MKLNFKESILSTITPHYLLPFALLTACFALWGFSNNVTNPMVNDFSKIFRISTTEASLVPMAYYLGYFVLAFPAAIFIQRYSYKKGVLVGLGLYAAGTLLFLPARAIGTFWPFLIAYFIMTCGLSFLETSCNPYIFTLGPLEKGIQRMNAAQAFNPIGALIGMYVAYSVHKRMSPMDQATRELLPGQQFELIKSHDLGVLVQPYFYIAALVLIILVAIYFTRMPSDHDNHEPLQLSAVLGRLYRHRNYREGVIAQFCYVGAQVMCWTFIIVYGMRVFLNEGMAEADAERLAQKYSLVAMFLFAGGRFLCTWLMQWFSSSRMLTVFSVLAAVAAFGVVLFTDRSGLYCLVFVSGCMSLMFPTIYGIALRGVGSDLKYASAGLVMAILGGSIFPFVQALIIDTHVSLLGLPSTNVSYFLSVMCFVVVGWYGHRAYVRHNIIHDDAA